MLHYEQPGLWSPAKGREGGRGCGEKDEAVTGWSRGMGIKVRRMEEDEERNG